jgi:PAS domain S-box-containing protein
VRELLADAARNSKLLDSRFGDLVESLPDAIVIVDVSARIVMLNVHAERLFGYPRRELIGHTVEVHISRLRQKLGDDSRQPKLLKTVRGLGYMLVAGDHQ